MRPLVVKGRRSGGGGGGGTEGWPMPGCTRPAFPVMVERRGSCVIHGNMRNRRENRRDGVVEKGCWRVWRGRGVCVAGGAPAEGGRREGTRQPCCGVEGRVCGRSVKGEKRRSIGVDSSSSGGRRSGGSRGGGVHRSSARGGGSSSRCRSLMNAQSVAVFDMTAAAEEEEDSAKKLGKLVAHQGRRNAKTRADASSSSSVLLNLMGLWDGLSSKISHMPGDPTVVAKAMKVALANATPHQLYMACELAARIADTKSRQAGSFSNDVVAAAILVSALPSNMAFPEKMVRHKVGRSVADICSDIVKVSKLPSRIDVYDDEAAVAARELCLAYYDINAISVEVLRRVVALESTTVVGNTSSADEGWDARRTALSHCLALEALQLYAPLGHALGLDVESLELENRSLELLFPTSFKQTCDWLSQYVSHHDLILESSRKALEQAVLSHPKFLDMAKGIVVQSRTKSAISTLKKLLRLGNSSQGGRAREEVFDVLGLRAIVLPRDDIEDPEKAAVEACYIVDEAARSIWPIVSSRSKDYIMSPKPNGYSSLHRTAIVTEGVKDEVTMVELQIRTEGKQMSFYQVFDPQILS